MYLKTVGLVMVLCFLLAAMLAIAHFFAPLGFLGYLFLFGLATGLIIHFGRELNAFIRSFLTYLFIGLYDIGFRYLSGGIHDWEGNGFIFVSFFIGLLPAFLVLCYGILSQNETPTIIKIASIALFALLIFLHLWLFSNAGIVDPGLN